MIRPRLALIVACMVLGCTLRLGASAQGLCSSDGQATPVRVVERFISADCRHCWRTVPSGTSGPAPATLMLDWIVPGRLGDEAPLSAAASRDALMRLQTLGRQAPKTQDVTSQRVASNGPAVRVAHGVALGGYIGASIEVRAQPGTGQGGLAVLLLVETIAAGTEGTPIERQLVRNQLQVPWMGHAPATDRPPADLLERRPLSIPEGTDPQRLRVVGWLQDRRGRLLAAAQSVCAAP